MKFYKEAVAVALAVVLIAVSLHENRSERGFSKTFLFADDGSEFTYSISNGGEDYEKVGYGSFGIVGCNPLLRLQLYTAGEGIRFGEKIKVIKQGH